MVTVFLCMVGLSARTAGAMPPGSSVAPLIDTGETVLGRKFAYSEGRARITAAVATVPPRAVLAPHLHEVPLFGYVSQGELIVQYGAAGGRIYCAGDGLADAIDRPHQGRNGGRAVVKILAVYAGAAGVPNSEPADLE